MVALAVWLGLAVATEVAQTQPLLMILAGIGGLLLPIWYIWLGLRLRTAR